MEIYDVTFERRIKVNGRMVTETRKVTGVTATSEKAARNKAFRKICFATKFDNWRFQSVTKKIEEIKQAELI